MACPKFVRQIFHEVALHSIGFSEWARAYYDEQLHQEAIFQRIQAGPNRTAPVIVRPQWHKGSGRQS